LNSKQNEFLYISVRVYKESKSTSNTKLTHGISTKSTQLKPKASPPKKSKQYTTPKTAKAAHKNKTTPTAKTQVTVAPKTNTITF
jgi:hypothetical protein